MINPGSKASSSDGARSPISSLFAQSEEKSLSLRAALTSLQYTAAAATYLIPSSIRYYEVWLELLLAVSRVCSYYLNGDEGSSSTLSVCVSLLSRVEVLAEKSCVLLPDEARHKAYALFGIELAKCLCRLAHLLTSDRATMLLSWQLASSEDNIVSQLQHYREWYSGGDASGGYVGRRCGVRLRNCSIRKSPRRVTDKVPLVGLTSDQLLQLGEILYTIRPVVYSYLLTLPPVAASDRGSDAKRVDNTSISNSALAAGVSLLIELLSLLCTSEALRRERCGPRKTTPHPMDQELARRRLALLFYLLRHPLYPQATQPLLRLLSSLTDKIPLLGGLVRKLVGMCEYLSSTYFYTSASS